MNKVARWLETGMTRLKERNMTKHKEEKQTAVLKSKSDKEVRNDHDALAKRNLSEQQKSVELQRQSIEDALLDNGVTGVQVTCPTPDTWRIDKNGKSESGNVTTPITTIVQRAQAL